MIAAADKPVITNDLALIMRAGKRPEWEPFTFPELAAKGLWNERPFTQRIRRQAFAFVVTDEDSADALTGAYGSAIAPVIAAAYPVTQRPGGMTVSLPRTDGRPEVYR